MEVFVKRMNLAGGFSAWVDKEIGNLRHIIKNAHICDIWALLVILLSFAVIFVISNMQGICKAGFAKRLVIGDQLSVISGENVDLGVDHG